MNNSLITLIGAIIILAIFGIAVFVKFKSLNKKALAEEFINGLEDHLTTSITSIINDIKPDKYSCLEDYESAILDKIYSDTWSYVESEAKLAYESNQIASAILSLISKDMVINSVNTIIDNIGAIVTIQNKFVSDSIESSNIEAEDKAAEEKFSNQTEYVEESDNSKLAPAEVQEHSPEETAALNPQTDSEEDYNVEDDSMELVTDKPEIIVSHDKNGLILYYEVSADGKKKRVSKDYALKML